MGGGAARSAVVEGMHPDARLRDQPADRKSPGGRATRTIHSPNKPAIGLLIINECRVHGL
jgi:hypothetical protein